jgi:hypothetical protein
VNWTLTLSSEFSQLKVVRTGACGMIKISVPMFELDRLDMTGAFIMKVTSQVASTYLCLMVRQKEDQKN